MFNTRRVSLHMHINYRSTNDVATRRLTPFFNDSLGNSASNSINTFFTQGAGFALGTARMG